jgi:hypothetical protein
VSDIRDYNEYFKSIYKNEATRQDELNEYRHFTKVQKQRTSSGAPVLTMFSGYSQEEELKRKMRKINTDFVKNNKGSLLAVNIVETQPEKIKTIETLADEVNNDPDDIIQYEYLQDVPNPEELTDEEEESDDEDSILTLVHSIVPENVRMHGSALTSKKIFGVEVSKKVDWNTLYNMVQDKHPKREEEGEIMYGKRINAMSKMIWAALPKSLKKGKIPDDVSEMNKEGAYAIALNPEISDVYDVKKSILKDIKENSRKYMGEEAKGIYDTVNQNLLRGAVSESDVTKMFQNLLKTKLKEGAEAELLAGLKKALRNNPDVSADVETMKQLTLLDKSRRKKKEEAHDDLLKMKIMEQNPIIIDELKKEYEKTQGLTNIPVKVSDLVSLPLTVYEKAAKVVPSVSSSSDLTTLSRSINDLNTALASLRSGVPRLGYEGRKKIKDDEDEDEDIEPFEEEPGEISIPAPMKAKKEKITVEELVEEPEEEPVEEPEEDIEPFEESEPTGTTTTTSSVPEMEIEKELKKVETEAKITTDIENAIESEQPEEDEEDIASIESIKNLNETLNEIIEKNKNINDVLSNIRKEQKYLKSGKFSGNADDYALNLVNAFTNIKFGRTKKFDEWKKFNNFGDVLNAFTLSTLFKFNEEINKDSDEYTSIFLPDLITPSGVKIWRLIEMDDEQKNRIYKLISNLEILNDAQITKLDSQYAKMSNIYKGKSNIDLKREEGEFYYDISVEQKSAGLKNFGNLRTKFKKASESYNNILSRFNIEGDESTIEILGTYRNADGRKTIIDKTPQVLEVMRLDDLSSKVPTNKVDSERRNEFWDAFGLSDIKIIKGAKYDTDKQLNNIGYILDEMINIGYKGYINLIEASPTISKKEADEYIKKLDALDKIFPYMHRLVPDEIDAIVSFIEGLGKININTSKSIATNQNKFNEQNTAMKNFESLKKKQEESIKAQIAAKKEEERIKKEEKKKKAEEKKKKAEEEKKKAEEEKKKAEEEPEYIGPKSSIAKKAAMFEASSPKPESKPKETPTPKPKAKPKGKGLEPKPKGRPKSEPKQNRLQKSALLNKDR